MKIELDKEDILCMLCSKSVPYELIDEFMDKKYGRYIGGFCDQWDWNIDKLRSLTEEDIYNIYLCLKNYKK